MPLTLGEFRLAAREIEARDPWLADRENVSCYTDRKGETHLDVVNFGGFIVTGGHVASRPVNPW